jgi:hypothetical protein
VPYQVTFTSTYLLLADVREAADTHLESVAAGDSDELWPFDIESMVQAEIPMSPYTRVARAPSGDFIDAPFVAGIRLNEGKTLIHFTCQRQRPNALQI